DLDGRRERFGRGRSRAGQAPLAHRERLLAPAEVAAERGGPGRERIVLGARLGHRTLELPVGARLQYGELGLERAHPWMHRAVDLARGGELHLSLDELLSQRAEPRALDREGAAVDERIAGPPGAALEPRARDGVVRLGADELVREVRDAIVDLAQQRLHRDG